MKNDPELMKTETKHDDVKDIKYKREEHDHENVLNHLKLIAKFSKRNNNLNKRKKRLNITENLKESASTINSSR